MEYGSLSQYFAYLTRMNLAGLTRPRIAFIARPPSQLYTSRYCTLKPNTTLTTLVSQDMEPNSSPDRISYLDIKDETKKKVTFAMVQSPSQDSVASIGSSLSINNNNNTDGSTGAGILVISPSHEALFSPSAATGEIQGETEHGQPRARPLGLGGDSLLGGPGAGQVPHHRDIPRVSGHLGSAPAGGAQVHQARVSAPAPVSGVRAPLSLLSLRRPWLTDCGHVLRSPGQLRPACD